MSMGRTFVTDIYTRVMPVNTILNHWQKQIVELLYLLHRGMQTPVSMASDIMTGELEAS